MAVPVGLYLLPEGFPDPTQMHRGPINTLMRAETTTAVKLTTMQHNASKGARRYKILMGVDV